LPWAYLGEFEESKKSHTYYSIKQAANVAFFRAYALFSATITFHVRTT